MRKISMLILLLLPAYVFSQQYPYKNIAGLEYLNLIMAPKDYRMNSGGIEKNGEYYLFTCRDSNDNGFVFRYRLNAKGQTKLENVIEIGDYKDRDFSGQVTLTADNRHMIFTSTKDNSWTQNDLCEARYLDGKNKYGDIRLLGEVNEDEKADAYPWLSFDGLRLYYIFNNTIQYAYRNKIGDAFTYPKALKMKNASSYSIVGCHLTEDENTLFFVASQKVYITTRESRKDEFKTPEILYEGFDAFISGIAISEKKNLLFLYYSGKLDEDDLFGEDYDESEEVILIYKMKKR
jgi:hypothetical protein